MDTSVLTNQATVKNCIGWAFSPLPQVGSQAGNLKTTPSGLDSASKIGCKSQSYTSWDCMSRTYYGGSYISASEEHDRLIQPREQIIIGDVPTPAEYQDFTPAQKILYDRKLRLFKRGKGLMSKAQMAKLMSETPNVASTQDQPEVSGYKGRTRAAKSAADVRPLETQDQRLGYFYSDYVPVRSLGVTSMTCSRESEPMPYSPVFQALAGRLNDPAQTGVLSSVIRGPNVRDSTTMTSLVKALMLRPSTRYELAGLIRCGAMAMSVAEESYMTDPIVYRFIRKPKNVSGIGLDILQKPGVVPDTWKAVAMPLDTFVALANNSYYSSPVPGFTYGGLDVNWTAVPVPSRLLGQSHLLAYLMSFLSSDSWSGTVSYLSSMRRTSPENPRNSYNTIDNLLPTINNIDVPGVRNVCLVLIDETSQTSCTEVRMAISDAVIKIPVWKGTNDVRPVSIWPLWARFWHADNIPGIRRDTILAHAEICTRLGISDACGTSLSVLAELYGQWYFGLAPQGNKEQPTPDYDQVPFGSWTYDGSALDKTGKMKSNKFNLDSHDKVDARRRTVAYNFSGISPQHVFPTGIVKIRYLHEEGDRHLRLSWSTQQPEVAVPTYNIQTMTSVMRVATALGLVLTHTESYRFSSPTGFVHWVHMLSSAISFTTASMLSINDITPRDWAGIYDKYDVAFKDATLNTLKDTMYGGILVHHNIQNFYQNIDEWDLDIMVDYWLMDPYVNPDWMTFSPVPAHCTIQWINKMGLSGGVTLKGVTTFRYNRMSYMAMKLQKDNQETKMLATTTIDAYRRYPQIILREPDENYRYILHWVDNVAGYSNLASSNLSILPPTDMYESLTFCAGIQNLGVPYSDVNDWYILYSNYEYGDPVLAEIKVTPIQWPDPPLIDTLWQGAKNYILKPAASALAGFLTGGPTGAAIAGASHIAQQVITDLTGTPVSKTSPTIAKKQEEGKKSEESKKPAQDGKTTTQKEPAGTSTKAQPTTKPTTDKVVPVLVTAQKQVTPVQPTTPPVQPPTGGKTQVENPSTITSVPEPLKVLSTPDESPANE